MDYFRDVIEILTCDHRAIEQMFAELDRLREAADEQFRSRRKEVAERLILDLARHAVAEEVVLHPRLREKAGEAEQAGREHIAIENSLGRLEYLRMFDPGFEAELQTLMAEVREHVAEEEDVLFPQLRVLFSQQELVTIGQLVEAVKEYVPPGPRLGAADLPPGSQVREPAVSLVDRLREAARVAGGAAPPG